MLSDKAKNIMDSGILRFSLITYGPMAGKMSVQANGQAGRKMYNEISAGKHRAEMLEIKAYLQAQEAEKNRRAAERQKKIDAIPGIKEIRDAQDKIDDYHRRLDEAMEAGKGWVSAKPAVSVNALQAKYPRAADYLMAEAWSYAANDRKAALGREAMEAIIDGGDHEAIIADMDRRWGEYCNSRLWD